MESFQQNIQVRWSDLDPNGHVRHSAYYDYGAQVRIAYLQKNSWMKTNGIGPVLFREEAKFYRELGSGDELVIDMRMSGLSEDQRKWSMHHRILRGKKLCATIDIDGGWLNLKTRRIVPPPEELVKQFGMLERTENFQVISAGRRN